MNKKLNKSLRLVCIIALWLVLIVACLRVYNLYQYNKVHPQDRYEWSSLEAPPEEFIIKSEMMEASRRTVLLGILIAVIWEVLLYFNDPKKHFITYLKEKIEPILEKAGDKLEKEKDDEDE